MANRHSSFGTIAKSLSHRQLRVNELIKRKLSEIFQRLEIQNSDLKDVSITIAAVNCSSDLKIARVYVLPLGGIEVDKAIKGLNSSRNEIKHQLGKTLELKYVPQLRFLADKTFDYIEETERLLSDPTVQKDIRS